MSTRTGFMLLAVLSLFLLACGDKKSAQVQASAPMAVAPVVDTTAGKSVYGKVCAMCHAIGAAGAPKPGDKTDWGPRIAQGEALLHKHALEGFTGAKGIMPPRGASLALKDEEVKAAVAYMVELSR
jgi:cytochrome c5